MSKQTVYVPGEYKFLLELVEPFSAHIDRKEATISGWIVGHARLFRRMRDEQGCSLDTFNTAMHWFHDNWPSDLEWPASVPRPSTPQNAVA